MMKLKMITVDSGVVKKANKITALDKIGGKNILS
jgi:hypothetical protein